MARTYNVGSAPPEINWTIVRGDTASFRVYVTDEAKVPLNIPDWTITMDIEREGVDVVQITPGVSVDDSDGEFTVSLSAAQSAQLETGDLFDIQMTDGDRVWTVAQGSMIVIPDVTE